MSLALELDIPETGAVFTFGKSHFADNEPSHFFIKNDPVVFIACGDEHTAVICQQGRVFGFGANSHGQLGLGHTNTVERPACLKWLKPRKATQIACGRGHTFILTDNNQLFSCGDNSEGQLGTGCQEPQMVPQFVEIDGVEDNNVIQITCGAEHTLVLYDSGRAYACGSNSDGQLGLGENVKKSTSFQLVPLENQIKFIACGYYNSIFIMDTGEAFACGENDNQYLGTPSVLMRIFEPEMVSLDGPIIAASSGANHTFFMVDGGGIYAVGSNSRGQLGLPKTIEDETCPKKINEKLFSGRSISKVACGSMHTSFVTSDGHMYTCGDSSHQKLCLDSDDIGNNNTENTDSHLNQFLPTLVTVLEGFNIDNVACGGCHTILSATKDPAYQNNNFDQKSPEHTNISILGELPPLQKVPLSILNGNSGSSHGNPENGTEELLEMNEGNELSYAESALIEDEVVKEILKISPIEINEDDNERTVEEIHGQELEGNIEDNLIENIEGNLVGNIEEIFVDMPEEEVQIETPIKLVNVLSTNLANIEEFDIENPDIVDETNVNHSVEQVEITPLPTKSSEELNGNNPLADSADKQSINSLEPNVSGSHILQINDLECATIMPSHIVDPENNKEVENIRDHENVIEHVNNEAVEDMSSMTHDLPIEAIEMVTPIETKTVGDVKDINVITESSKKDNDAKRSEITIESIGSPMKTSLLSVPQGLQHSPVMSTKSECSQKTIKSSTGSPKSENETIICHSDKSSPQMIKISKTQAVIPILRSEDSSTIINELIDDETDIVQSKISKSIDNEGKISKFFHGSCMGKTRVLSSVDIKGNVDAADSSIQMADQTNSKTCVIL